ncbi:hypothetical protein HDU80_001366, partial [Chytriomyces hyalinus]
MAPTPTILTRFNAAEHFPQWFTAAAESINAVEIPRNLFHGDLTEPMDLIQSDIPGPTEAKYPATVVTAAIPFCAATANVPEIPFQPAVLNNNSFRENHLKWTTLLNAICCVLQSRVNGDLGDHFVVDPSDLKTPYQRFQALQTEVSQGQVAMVDSGVELMTRMKQSRHETPLEYSLQIKELKVLLARNGYPSLTLERLEVYNDRFQWNAAKDGTPQAPCTSLDMQRTYLQEEHARRLRTILHRNDSDDDVPGTALQATSGPHGK